MLGRLPLCSPGSLLLYKFHSFRLFTSGRSSSKNAVLCSDTSCDSFLWLLCLGAIRTVDSFLYIFESSREISSSETQGQLVGTTGFSWAKVYNKSGRAPGHLLLPNEFQKRLKSRLLIGQKNIFLANQRRGTAGRLSCLLTRGCFPHRTVDATPCHVQERTSSL